MTPEASVLLVGFGNMGRALVNGWLERGRAAQGIHVVDPDSKALEAAEQLGIGGSATLAAVPAAFRPDVVLLAVKPAQLSTALAECGRFARSGALFVSIAAGKPIAAVTAGLGAAMHVPAGRAATDEYTGGATDDSARGAATGDRDAGGPEQGIAMGDLDTGGPGQRIATAVVRAMPNTPAAVGRGMTVLVANEHVSAAQRASAEALMAAVGAVEWVADEALMDAVTAVSGSGPAYVFLLIETLAAAGVSAGLDATLAARLATVTVAGAGAYAERAGVDAAELRRRVTSPGGTTEAALGVLMGEGGFAALLERAVAAAAERSRELSQA